MSESQYRQSEAAPSRYAIADDEAWRHDEASAEAVIEQDLKGVITYWNAAAERLFGFASAEAIGLRSHLLVPPRNRDRSDEGLKAALAAPAGHVVTRQVTAQHRDGHEFTVEFIVRVQRRPDGPRVVAVVRLVSEPRLGQEAFSGRDERYRSILDQIEDGCSVVDLRGNYLYVNEACCRMYGLRREDLLGQNFKATVTPQLGAKFRAIYAQVYETGHPVRSFEYEVASPDGRVHSFEQSVSLERDAAGRPIGFLGIHRDCTSRKLAEREIARARETAESASRAKSEFLANMSHEIRTPMNGIIGMTELALDTDLTLYQADCLNTVKASAESLLTIINDILDFSKIESRKLELEAVPFLLSDVISETLKPLAIKAHEKEIEIIEDVDGDVPGTLVGDPVRLRQVLMNLVSNGIKFTSRGQVVLSVRVEARGDGCVRLCFKVADSGVGIAPEKQSSIFEAFAQADTSTTRRFGGTGLGLAISSTLVQMMGGRIALASRPGEGSTFHFTLPFDTAAAMPAAPTPKLLDIPVLVVDDNAVNRRVFEGQLLRWGMKPTSVDGGQAALAALRTASQAGRPFGLVLLDAHMPNVDGFGVARAMQEDPELAGATIMMLTSGGQYGDANRCRDLGIAGYLTKPVKQNDLLEAIGRALEGSARSQGAQVPRPSMAAARSTRSLDILLAEDNLVNQRVAVGLLEKRGHRVTIAQNGREAVAAAEREAFDLILMDVQMPEMGGFEATAAIRAREQGTARHLRIIAMTAHAMTGDRERCLAAGMDAYLSKPIDPAALFSLVEAEKERGPVQPPASPRTVIDRDQLLARVGGDEGLLAELVQLFLADCPLRLAAIRQAVETRDAKRLKREAHTLKGAAGSMSAPGLTEAAAILERIGAEARLEAMEAAWRRLSSEASDVIDLLRRFK